MYKLFFTLVLFIAFYMLTMAFLDHSYLLRDAKGQIENHYTLIERIGD